MAGLETRPGRGRKAILQEQDLESVRQVVAQHRQRLSVAKTELEQALGKSFSQETLARFVKNGGRCKRVKTPAPHEPHAEVYALKVEGLKLLEAMSECGWIDLLYGDESRVSLQPCVPYAWQFRVRDLHAQHPGTRP